MSGDNKKRVSTSWRRFRVLNGHILILQIVDFHNSRGRLTEVEKPDDLFRIAFIERKHKRRIVNFEELVASCNLWQLPQGTRYSRVECWAINLDDSEKYLENLSQLRSVDALVSVNCNAIVEIWL